MYFQGQAISTSIHPYIHTSIQTKNLNPNAVYAHHKASHRFETTSIVGVYLLSPTVKKASEQKINLSPFAQQSHDSGSKEQRAHHEGQTLVVLGAVGIEQEVAGKELDETGVDQDTS